MPPEAALSVLLKKRFGFDTFRPYQEEVCAAVAQGQDALLVMPTGAGKSLCYQLPGVARGGTTLVISPLLALIEDQVVKLRAGGFRAERIHSGRGRVESRAVCEEYLQGKLDFLFIAPERLAVPGFPEMLAKRRLALVAIDEAHCISAWGHDFRPEYRMLGARLPSLRSAGAAPAPVIALTATATPRVQRDILAQLALPNARAFIHGFRRDNIAISIEECPQGERADRIVEVLAEPGRLPAIVYSTTRKNAEALSKALSSRFPVALYHAGLSKEERERTQTAFLRGEAEIMVATVAFGMGIDKANVRTVVHAALPSSLEGYYQEIGRAGRDGIASRALLLWSFADRKMHEFLHEKNYPEPAVLDRVADAVRDRGAETKESLSLRLQLDEELVGAAVEKLWVHNGLVVDPDETLHPGKDSWRASYTAQRDHRIEQMKLMAGFAHGLRCRMLHLVRHFGDALDSGRPCGVCDVCAPDDSRLREPDARELQELRAILRVAEEREGQSTARMHREGAPKLDRKIFDEYLAALSRAGLIQLEDRAFEKDGRSITYRAALVTYDGDSEELLSQVRLARASNPSPRHGGVRRKLKGPIAEAVVNGSSEEVEARSAALKAWRLARARERQVPAFTILSDRTLLAIATAKPADLRGLEAVHGMGPKLVEKHGKGILEVLSRSS